METEYGAILNAIKSAIVNGGVVTETDCYVSYFPDETVHPSGDMLCVVSPAIPTPRQDVITGAGNAFAWMVWEVNTTLWVRLALDRAAYQTDQFTHASLGLIKRVDAIISALQIVMIADTDVLVVEPMRLNSIDYGNRRENTVGWYKATLNWDVPFRESLT